MPFVAYVHAREPDPPEDGGRTPWEPNWRIWRWVAAAIVVDLRRHAHRRRRSRRCWWRVFALCCRAALELLPDGDGLREWRQ